ncbi:MAG: hypothetical protein M1812_003106 [Candelaria pacifica]|nr:MAG: hypothetical protein M1812_003106 [Candelaria pacifica]
MEPPRKRQRISSPVDLGVLDPEDDFLKARTQNDFRLKSTFESIFEKYSKDFSTVGDVIDLETGEIVVNNGHLRKMRDEQDAGKLLNMLMAAPGDYDDLGDYDAEEIERKAILAIPELEEFFADSHSRADAGGNRAAISGNPSSPLDPGLEETLRKEASLDGQSSSASQRALPSSADILQQFGTNLGPRIIQYVAQLQAGSTSDVEPLWRTPALSHAPPAKEDTIKTVQKPLPGDRAASPTCRSIWGSKGTKAQLKKQACSVAEPAQKNGQKSVGVVLNKDRHSAPFKPLQNGVLSYSPNTRRKLKGGPIPTTADSRAKPDGNPVVLPEGEESLRDEQPEDIVRQNEAAIDEIPVSNIKLRRSARLRSAPDVIRDVQYSKSPMKIASVATGQQSRPPEKKVLSQE